MYAFLGWLLICCVKYMPIIPAEIYLVHKKLMSLPFPQGAVWINRFKAVSTLSEVMNHNIKRKKVSVYLRLTHKMSAF